MAIDWSQYEVKDNGAQQSVIPATPFNQASQQDWSKYEQPQEEDDEELQPPEETGVVGVYHDIQDMLGNALGKASDFVEQAPENFSRIKEDVSENGLKGVGHILGQLHAGNANLAKSIVNTPHDFAKYLIRKHLGFEVPVPGTKLSLSDLIPHIPEDTGVEKALGLEADPERGDELTRAIPGIVAGGAGLKSAFSGVRKMLKAPDLKQSIRDTQAVVNAETKASGKVFDKIEKAVEDRGITNIRVDSELLKKAKGFLADTPENSDLIARAKKGDYKAIRGIQKDLRIHAEKALASKFESEHKRGKEISSVRDRINKGLEKAFKDTGNEDLAQDLSETRAKYRDIKETYFSTPSLAKVFGESQKVPKNPMTLLTEESTEMKRFMAKHPEVEKKLAKALSHKQNMKRLKGAGTILGIGTVSEMARKIFGSGK